MLSHVSEPGQTSQLQTPDRCQFTHVSVHGEHSHSELQHLRESQSLHSIVLLGSLHCSLRTIGLYMYPAQQPFQSVIVSV